jgi:hypothetical protein
MTADPTFAEMVDMPAHALETLSLPGPSADEPTSVSEAGGPTFKLQVPELPEPIDTGKTLDELTGISNANAGVTTLSAEDVALMMRQIRTAHSRIAEEVATCDSLRAKLHEELAMVDEHEHKVTKGDIEHIAFLTAQLEAHLLNVRAAEPNVKSIATPWGVIHSKVQQPEYKRDESLLVEWAEGAGFTRLKTMSSVDWEGIKKASHVRGEHLVMNDDGQIVAGVEVIERGPKVTVEVFD